MKGMCTMAFKENSFRKEPDAAQGQFLTLWIKANQGQRQFCLPMEGFFFCFCFFQFGSLDKLRNLEVYEIPERVDHLYV